MLAYLGTYVIQAAIANFYIVLIQYFMQFMMAGKVFVYKFKELMAYISFYGFAERGLNQMIFLFLDLRLG